MKTETLLSPETYRRAVEFLRLGNEGVRRAQRESHELGLATVYQRNGTLYWELPSGEITFEDPYREGGPLAEKSRPSKTSS